MFFLIWNKKTFQRAKKSYQFYKGSIDTLNMPNENYFRLLPQNEHVIKDGDELANAHSSDDATDDSKLTFSDFCE